MSQNSYNLFKRFEVALQLEFINSCGSLTGDSDIKYEKVWGINSALTHEEEINSYIGTDTLDNTTSTYISEPQHSAINTFYLHKNETNDLANRQKY